MVARVRTCICVLVALLTLGAPFVVRADLIDSFSVSIRILPDASIEVTETIQYDFGREEHHGIYRNIPVAYQDANGKRTEYKIDNVTVTDGAGTPYNFTSVRDSDDLQLKIGSEQVLVKGKQTYEVSYVAHNVIGFFRDHDELYWNTTGNEWLFPIVESSARVYAPASTTQSACYIGAAGSDTPCASIETISADGSALFFESGKTLLPLEGLTVAVGFPKGVVSPPEGQSQVGHSMLAFASFLVPILALAYMLRRWLKYGRDERGRGTIIPEYESPAGITPAMASVILHERVKSASLSATLIELAVRGYLTIHRDEEKTLGIFTSTKYRFDKIKPADSALSADETTLFNALFKNRESVSSEDLKTSGELVTAQQKIKTDLAALMVSEGYYRANPTTERLIYAGIGLLAGALGFLAAIGFESALPFIGGAITSVMTIMFGLFMPAKTKKGTLAKEALLGLQDYLQIAEKNRLDFHNAPEKSPALFEKLLPYAILLGVSAAWAKEFEGLYTTPPRWYSGGSYAVFAPTVFADDMNSMATAVTALATPTSGGGGSGGGGSSGGGFGGGGGGSW